MVSNLLRETALFPARDLQLFRKQLTTWAGNFFSAVCFTSNDYVQFDNSRRLLAAVGESGIMTDDQEIFPALKKSFSEEPDWLFGYFSYDLKQETEKKIFCKPDARFDGIQFARGHFFRPLHIIEVTGDFIMIHSAQDPEQIYKSITTTTVNTFTSDKNKKLHQRISRSEYLKTVAALKNHIDKGDVYEINFCQEFFAENIFIDPPALFNTLNEISPAPFACFLKHGEKFLLCASPERFLKKKSEKIISQPMKGTSKRNGSDAVADSKAAEILYGDEKERAENVMIVDLVRNDLARSAIAGSVKVEELFGVYSFPHVHQMISTVSATLRADVHFADAIKNAFPMGSMTGAPKVMAMQLIDQYEKVRRGLFSGAVGYITPEADFDFNVVIRSLLYNRSANYLSFQTGSAITHDCIPEKEYDECLLKAQAIIKALEIDFASTAEPV